MPQVQPRQMMLSAHVGRNQDAQVRQQLLQKRIGRVLHARAFVRARLIVQLETRQLVTYRCADPRVAKGARGAFGTLLGPNRVPRNLRPPW